MINLPDERPRNCSHGHVPLVLMWLVAACTGGCTPYSFSGGRTALVSSIAVPLFENETPQFGLAETLTKGIVDGFVRDNQVKVVNESAAQAILRGRIVEYTRKAYTFDEHDRVTEYIVEIWVTANLTKKSDSAAVWSVDRLRGFGLYNPDNNDDVQTGKKEDEESGQRRAIAKITEDLLNRTIKSW